MTLLADLVRTSQRVGATAARLSKVRELASFLLALPPDEIETAAHYLSGEMPQGRIGIGYSTLQAAAASGAASAETLSLAEVDRSLAQIAADVGEALTELQGEVAFEWKMDGARIQVHKGADEVRIYTRALNDVTGALPEIVAVARTLPGRTLVLDGEAIAFDASGRPH